MEITNTQKLGIIDILTKCKEAIKINRDESLDIAEEAEDSGRFEESELHKNLSIEYNNLIDEINNNIKQLK